MAKHEDTPDPEESAEAEVVFEPSPQMVEAVNVPADDTVAGEPPEPPSRDPADYAGVAGVYIYEGSEPTQHTVLGELVPGENDFSGITHPEMLKALQELAADGALKKK